MSEKDQAHNIPAKKHVVPRAPDKNPQRVKAGQKNALKRPDFKPSIEPLAPAHVKKGMSHDQRMDQYRDRLFTLLRNQIPADVFLHLDQRSETYLGSFADNTEVAMYGDLIQYVEYCLYREVTPLPFMPHTIDLYLSRLMGEGYKRSTIDRRVASLVKWADMLEWDDPRGSHKVKARLAKIRKNVKKSKRQAEGLRLEHLKEALEVMDPAVPRDCQDIAMVWIAFETMCREAEFVALDWEDLRLDADGSGTFEVHTSKTDQDGEGALQNISSVTVSLLLNWQQVSGKDSGAVFRGVYSNGKLGDRLSTRGVDRCFKRIVKRLGLDPSIFSGHSCRVGAAQDMVEAGVDQTKIILTGRWANDAMLVSYSKRIRAKKSGMADFMGMHKEIEPPPLPQIASPTHGLVSTATLARSASPYSSPPALTAPPLKSDDKLRMSLYLRVEKNGGGLSDSTVRNVRKRIEQRVLSYYQVQQYERGSWWYWISVDKEPEAEEFNRQLRDLAMEIEDVAEPSYCWTEVEFWDEKKESEWQGDSWWGGEEDEE